VWLTRPLFVCLVLIGALACDGFADDRAIYEGEHVFGWIDGSDPDMPVWSDADGGFVRQEGDPRPQIVIDETFRVAAGETHTFTDTVLYVRPTQRGDIEVYGTLILSNCLLLWEQTEHQQARLRVKSGGTLRATDCYSFSGNPFWVNWDFESGSTIIFDRFVGDPWTSIEGAVDYEATNYSTVSMTLQNTTRGSHVRIQESHHVWLEIFPPAYRTIDITFARKRQWVDWILDGMWPNTTVHIEDSYIYERDISLTRGTHVTVRDTTDGIGVGWAIYKNTPGYVECEIAGLGTPGSDAGTYYAEETWHLPRMDASLTLINSRLLKAWPTTWGYVHLVVRDSNLADPRVWGGPATYEIYDSTIDLVAAYAEGRMYLEECLVRHGIEVKDAGSFVYGCRLRGEGASAVLEVDGGAFVSLDVGGPPW